jgi:hypothetical protein
MELIPFWVRHRRRREREVSPWLRDIGEAYAHAFDVAKPATHPGIAEPQGPATFSRAVDRADRGDFRQGLCRRGLYTAHRVDNPRAPCQGGAYGQERQERPHRGPQQSGRERLAEDRESTANRAPSMSVHPMASARQSVARPGMRSRRSPMRSIVRTPPIPEPQINRWHSRSARSKVVDRRRRHK